MPFSIMFDFQGKFIITLLYYFNANPQLKVRLMFGLLRGTVVIGGRHPREADGGHFMVDGTAENHRSCGHRHQSGVEISTGQLARGQWIQRRASWVHT